MKPHELWAAPYQESQVRTKPTNKAQYAEVDQNCGNSLNFICIPKLVSVNSSARQEVVERQEYQKAHYEEDRNHSSKIYEVGSFTHIHNARRSRQIGATKERKFGLPAAAC